MSIKSVKGDGFAKFKKVLTITGKPSVKIGWFKKHKYPAEQGGLPVAYVASIQEYGWPAKGIPARPFMLQTKEGHEKEWREISRGLIRQILNTRNYTESMALQTLGEKVRAHIQLTISEGSFAPLSAYTIRRRLARYSKKDRTASNEKPLIDTGVMHATVTSTLEDV